MTSAVAIDKNLSQRLANMGFVCACFVVFLHVPFHGGEATWGWNVKRMLCFAFDAAVPWFFIVSGFFLAGKFPIRSTDGSYKIPFILRWWKDESMKRIRSLVVPYVIWNFLYFGFVFCLGAITARYGVKFGGAMSETTASFSITSILGLCPFQFPQLPFLWFVRCLIAFVCIAPVFSIFASKFGGVMIIITFVFYCILPDMLPKLGNWETGFLISSWLKGFLYFSTGFYLRNNASSCAIVRKCRHLCLVGSIVFLVVAVIPQIASYGALMRICVSVGQPLFLVGLWYCIPCLIWPRSVTSLAFPIFLLHSAMIIVLAGMERIVGLKGTAIEWPLPLYFFETILVICGAIVGSSLVRWMLPKAYYIAFGGR